MRRAAAQAAISGLTGPDFFKMRQIWRSESRAARRARTPAPFGKPFTGQFVTFKVDVPVPRVHESLTAGGDIQRRASVAPDQLGSLFAADDLHQFFTLFLPTQRDAERNGKTWSRPWP